VLRAGVGHLGVDATEQADAQIAIEIAVVAARLGWGGLGARARLRGRVGARGAIAADAVAEHGHDSDVEREAEQAEQCGVDPGAFFGREGVGREGVGRGFPIGLGGLWREGDWRVPEGGCGLHVPYPFYMGQENGRRKGFFASAESFFAAVGDRAGGGSAASTACFGFSVRRRAAGRGWPALACFSAFSAMGVRQVHCCIVGGLAMDRFVAKTLLAMTSGSDERGVPRRFL
jgi:hypothetical protein